MRECETGTGTVHLAVLPPVVNDATAGELDAIVEPGARSLVVDAGRATVVDGEARYSSEPG